MSEAFRDQRYRELASIVRKQGGKLKTPAYTFLRTPMTVECANGHRFKMTPKNLLRGLWCSECRPAPRQEQFLALAQKTARAHGGKVLSEVYENARTPLKWQCGKKHRWEASLDNVVNKNSWCPTCAVESASDRKTQWWKKQRTKRAKRK